MNKAHDNSRRDILLKSAALGAGAVIVGSHTLNAETPANAGNGPYATEAMAGSSETAPLTPFKFQRRVLGPKTLP
jgi:hypothetical protein